MTGQPPDDLAARRRAAADELTRPLAEALGQLPPIPDAAPQFDIAASQLRTFPGLMQGTDEWYDQRRGMITASVIGQLLTPQTLAVANNDTSRGLTAQLAAERITGHTDLNYVSDDMWRGIDDEPRAAAVYSQHFAPVTPDGFMVRSWGRCQLGYSADGLVGDDGLIEVKSHWQKKQLQTVLSGEVPAENMAQLQAGLFVSGRDWIDYISFSGGMALWVKRVRPDLRWFGAVVAAVEAFEDAAAGMVDRYTAAVQGLPLTERPALEMVI